MTVSSGKPSLLTQSDISNINKYVGDIMKQNGLENTQIHHALGDTGGGGSNAFTYILLLILGIVALYLLANYANKDSATEGSSAHTDDKFTKATGSKLNSSGLNSSGLNRSGLNTSGKFVGPRPLKIVLTHSSGNPPTIVSSLLNQGEFLEETNFNAKEDQKLSKTFDIGPLGKVDGRLLVQYGKQEFIVYFSTINGTPTGFVEMKVPGVKASIQLKSSPQVTQKFDTKFDLKLNPQIFTINFKEQSAKA